MRVPEFGPPTRESTAVEEVHEEEKAKASRMQHFAMALGRPFTKKGGTMCHLNIEVRAAGLAMLEHG